MALRIAAWLLPRDAREEVLGDLVEAWQAREHTQSRWARARWTLRQPFEALRTRLTPSGLEGDSRTPPLRVIRREPWLGVSWLDVKLGLRMLARYPVMTLVSGLAIAVTLAVAIGTFSFFQDFVLRPIVPLDEGDRIVSLGLRTTDTNRTFRSLLHEFSAWRAGLETVEELGLWRSEAQSIATDDGQAELASFAVMSAAGFRVARVPPLLGRPLVDADEIEGAPPVVVLGYDEWVNRFQADADVIGRQVRIGRDMHTAVGVMPEGFEFPYAERMWLPLRDDPADYPLTEGPCCYFAFGRLALGVTLEQARAEMNALMAARASLPPDTHARLRGQVMTYTDTHTGMDDADPNTMVLVRLVMGLLTLVVLIPFANVAILIYARTATRTGEIAVRSALGASRRRVITQLFAEALVLSAVSAAAGLGLALFALDRIDYFMDAYIGSGMPFWADSGRNPRAIAYGTGLTVVAAVVAGVVPGLQATGKRAGANLKSAASGNGLRLGKLWTGLVVTQVAITVACLPLAGGVAWQAIGMRLSEATFPAEEYLTARLVGPFELDVRDNDLPRDAAESIGEVVRRLEADARVRAVAVSTRSPSEVYSEGFSDFARFEIDGIETPDGGHPVGSMAVDPGFFGFLGVEVLSGWALINADIEAAPPPIVVNQAFVEKALGGANPIGRYIREYRQADDELAPWMEIVGVVEELQRNPLRPEAAESRIFSSLDRRELRGAHVTVHARSAPEDLAAELRRIVTAVDPALRVYDVSPLSEPTDPMRALMGGLSTGIGFVLLSILLLCTAGIFSLISFNVTQRRREIGIRSALGASPHRVLGSVMVRSAKQLAIGVAVGLLIVASTPPIELDGVSIHRDMRLVVGVALIMVTIGLLAAVGPARRGLRIQPTEALSES